MHTIFFFSRREPVEVVTFEVLLVKMINVFKLQASIFEYPVACFPFSVSRVPNEDCKRSTVIITLAEFVF